MELDLAPGRVLAVLEGDITAFQADVIVNAANAELEPGAGVCGAIHNAGGPAILADLERRYGRTRSCPTGSAVVSDAGDLPARWVIHAVGPVWWDGAQGEAELLASAYRTSVELADSLGAASIAFPAISTGIYGYPPDEAAPVAVRAVAEAVRASSGICRAVLLARSPVALSLLEAALATLRRER